MFSRPLVTSYRQHIELLPTVWHRGGALLVALCAFMFPLVVSDHLLSTGTLALVTIVGAIALMILTGFAGLISLGHAGFLALGAYATAVLGEQLAWPFWLTLPCAGCVAGIVGLIVGPFALRLEGMYLAIVTLGLGVLVNHVLTSFDTWTHGAMGIAVPARVTFAEGASGSSAFDAPIDVLGLHITREVKLFWTFSLITAFFTWLAANLQRSNTGRAMMAVRDHDIAAAVMGIHPARTKVIAFVVSSFVAGVAGGMFALQQQYITIEPPFDLTMSVWYLAIVVFGGIGTVFGAVWGALVATLFSPIAELISEALTHVLPLVSGLSDAQLETLLFSVFVVLLMLYEPRGLVGIWLRLRRLISAWPFRR